MFDSDVESLAHGDGTSRVHPYVVAHAIRELLNPHCGSLDDYLFLKPHTRMMNFLEKDFLADGICQEDARNLAVDFGSSTLIVSALQCIKRRSKGEVTLVVPSSFYHNVVKWAEMTDVKFRHLITGPESSYKISAQKVMKVALTIKNPTNMVLFLQNPNHGGSLYSDRENKELAETISRLNLWVIVDSVFSGT